VRLYTQLGTFPVSFPHLKKKKTKKNETTRLEASLRGLQGLRGPSMHMHSLRWHFAPPSSLGFPLVHTRAFVWCAPLCNRYVPWVREVKFLKFLSLVDSGSLKVVWVTYQIVASTSFNLDIQ